MASSAVVTAVEARLAANWTDTPVISPNVTGDTPPDGSPFVTLQFPVAVETHVGMANVGNRTFREEGTIRFVLTIARVLGQSVGLKYCDDLAALFRATQFDGVSTFAASPPIVNNANDEGNYWVMSVSIPYYFYRFA
jgi:hypothetical protein